VPGFANEFAPTLNAALWKYKNLRADIRKREFTPDGRKALSIILYPYNARLCRIRE